MAPRVFNIKAIDQLITALISYFPLLLPLYQRDLKSLAYISTTLMAYAIILGLIRNTFVNVIYSDKTRDVIHPRVILVGLVICLLPLTTVITMFLLQADVSWSHLFVAGILGLSGLQEIFRQILLKFEFSKRATFADASWLITMVFFAIFLHGLIPSTLELMAVCWVIGIIISLVLQAPEIFRAKRISSKVASGSVLSEFLVLGFASVLSTSHGFVINLIFQWRNLDSDLGLYRGLLFFFLPISFLINYQQIVFLPLFSSGKSYKREEHQFTKTALLFFPFLAIAAVMWVFQDINIYSLTLGVLTGSIPLVVLHSNRLNLRIINLGKMNTYLGLRKLWLFVSIIAIGFVSSFGSLLVIVSCSLVIEILYFVLVKNQVRKISSREISQVNHEPK